MIVSPVSSAHPVITQQGTKTHKQTKEQANQPIKIKATEACGRVCGSQHSS